MIKKWTYGFSRKILLLGSGFVAAPFVEYVLRRPENKLTIGMNKSMKRSPIIN